MYNKWKTKYMHDNRMKTKQKLTGNKCYKVSFVYEFCIKTIKGMMILQIIKILCTHYVKVCELKHAKCARSLPFSLIIPCSRPCILKTIRVIIHTHT